MHEENSGRSNVLLGYPPDARLLIINADDFGMCHAVNTAIIDALHHGVVRSTTLMAPCPWAGHAAAFLASHPEIPFGVHLTVISDWSDYRWGPLAPREKVPSLLNCDGYFHNFEHMPRFLAQVQLDELELEFRTQIEWALAAGLQPTHLDWHSLRIPGGDPVSELMFTLARAYGLALRVRGRAWIETVQARGFPANDYDFLDSYLLDPATKSARCIELLRTLPPGLSEWAVHPGFDNAELRTIDPGGSATRQSDYDFLISPAAKAAITQAGITLLDYRALQAVWRGR